MSAAAKSKKNAKSEKGDQPAGAKTAMPSVDEQMVILTRGVDQIETMDDLRKKVENAVKTGKPLRVKLGIDPSSPDIHVGHCVVLRKLRQFQDLGHKAVLIIGTATAMVGDPSGRNKTRPTLTEDEVGANAQTYLDQVAFVLDQSPEKLEIVKNGDWFSKMTFADILRLFSRVTIAQMLTRKDFADRFAEEKEIRLHELVYPCMQGWDSVEVEADVELGGTDQLFNLLVGRDFLAQEGQPAQVCMMTPLINGLDGQKMSKSYNNHIGVAFPPEDVFGKTMAITDDAMKQFFVSLTDIPLAEVDALLAPDAHPVEAKRRLAWELTAWLHGAEKADAAREHFDTLFRKKEVPDEMPDVAVPDGERNEDGTVALVKLIVLAGFAKSNSDARRKIEQGGVSIDDEKITDPKANVPAKPGAVLKVGKRSFARLQ